MFGGDIDFEETKLALSLIDDFSQLATKQPILKNKLKDVLREIARMKKQAPIKMGDILIENILNLGANVIASRDLVKLG